MCIILKLVYPLLNRLRSRWVWSRGKCYYVMAKLDPIKRCWIIRQKESGRFTTKAIAGNMGVSEIWVKKLWSRYKKTGAIPVLKRPGRETTPENCVRL